MKKFSSVLLGLLVCVLISAPFTAYATTYVLKDVLFNSAGKVGVEIDGVYHYYGTGDFSVSIEGITQEFTAFCIDPDQPTPVGYDVNIEVELVNASEAVGGLEAAWLLDNIDNWDAKALQVAIWEIVKDNNAEHLYDLNTGNFQLINPDATTLATANSYLDYLYQNFDPTGLAAYFMASKTPTKQDLIYYGTIFDEPSPPPITDGPEPATMLLLTSGVIGLAGLRRKFSKKS